MQIEKHLKTLPNHYQTRVFNPNSVYRYVQIQCVNPLNYCFSNGNRLWKSHLHIMVVATITKKHNN